jgi:O-antigen/teichoic acid export membrane protein
MKQSIGLIILQVLGIALGLISIFWIAGSLPAKEYAILGIYNVISSFILVFSNTGIETYAIRNVLSWKENGENEKIKLIITQAIAYRTILASITFFPLIGYSIYISTQKFNNQHLTLFILMGLFSIAKATNDSVALILRSFNKYFEASLISYIINVFGRILALILFFKYGFDVYIATTILLPLLVTLPVIYRLKKWISFNGVFQKTNLLKSFNESKSFALSSYISYVFNFFDQLIVSIFMSAEIIGSFTVAKNLLLIGKTFIENIFDPLIQNLVRFKNDINDLTLKLNRVYKVRNVLLISSIVFFPFILFFIDKGLTLIRLFHYPYLSYFAISIYLSQIAHIGMKVKYNYIALFYKSSYYLKLTIVNAILSIIFFISMISIDIKMTFLYILLTNGFMIIYTDYIFKKQVI